MSGNNSLPAPSFGIKGNSGFAVSFQGRVKGLPMGTIARTGSHDRIRCRLDEVCAAGLNHQPIWCFFCLKFCPQKRPTRQNTQARNTATKDRLPVVDVGCMGCEKRNLRVVYCQNHDSHLFGDGNMLVSVLRDDIWFHKGLPNTAV